MRPLRLAIVGGGPSATYVMERLAATAPCHARPFSLDVHVFDSSGRFGDGQVHSSGQPATSFLNRIVGQVSFAADETVMGAGPLLDPQLRPTLHEWCRRQFAETGDPLFDLAPEDWPKRYVHGLALRESFARYVELLRAHPSVDVMLHPDEVVDVTETTTGFELRTAGGTNVPADHILFVTGHSWNDPAAMPRTRSLLEFAERNATVYVPSAYPLENHLTTEVIKPGCVVACAGMGLTAIDILLYLSEGRGGTFERQPDGTVRYQPSGAEPGSIVVYSEAGLFTFARPFNAKERDPELLEHRGVFLVEAAVDRLRESIGTPMEVGSAGLRRQLDFERHLLPVVLLEMAALYYRTLLGADAHRLLCERVGPAYEAFLDGRGDYTAPETLVSVVSAVVNDLADVLDPLLCGRIRLAEGRVLASAAGWDLDATARRYLEVVFGASAAADVMARLAATAPDAPPVDVVTRLRSPWRHATSLRDNAFSWQRVIRPVDATGSPEAYRDAVLDFMDRDHRFAAQDNLTNPAKAAADGVWRDLRSVLAYAVDFGGLTADSHRQFLDVYLRHHNRVCNGAALEVMEKMKALIEHGLVDVSAGPNARLDTSGDRFVVHSPHTGARIPVDIVVDAKVHAFDPERDIRPLYPNLLRRGLVHKWHNPSADGATFEPGGLDLTADFHAIRPDGQPDPRLTFLGPPSEGVMFFQLGALRPNQNHHVMRDILCWLDGFWAAVRDNCADDAHDLAETSST